MAETPIVHVRIQPSLVDSAREALRLPGETTSTVIKRALAEVADPESANKRADFYHDLLVKVMRQFANPSNPQEAGYTDQDLDTLSIMRDMNGIDLPVSRETCDWYLASHGCNRPLNHEGAHLCGVEATDGEDYCGFTWNRGQQYEFQVKKEGE